MTYLIYYKDDKGKPVCFSTNWFQFENHYRPGMVVVNQLSSTWTDNGVNWKPIEKDHL